MQNYRWLLGLSLIGAVAACKAPKEAEPVISTVKPVALRKIPEPQVYNPSRTRVNDLINTKLDVSFNYGKQYVNGKAWVTVKPHFNPAFYLDLDAVGFTLNAVELVTPEGNKPLKYVYDGKVLVINLNRLYKNHEQYTVYIDYVAKPNELKTQGSAAINDAKGIYFINPLGKDKNKPTQIWTQGETQANSCWFPTIDATNQRMTQEISITVDKKYTTLSNGLLIKSTENPNNTRTDVWQQSLPAAPYLTMMAIGEYAVVKDKWRKKEVNYYVEKEYEQYAKKYFGASGEILEFYSNKFGIDYPWEKLSHVVVRDYISGAMENTSAILYGEFMNQNERELIDSENEDVVAHEIAHHWFGDLVTAESWSNLPLNEAFATYSEYLWKNHKYGQDEADRLLQAFSNKYFKQAAAKNQDLVRFNYNDKEEMFDAITYEKGACILHMLRRYVGDDAFFTSIRKYLDKFKYSSAEVHDLRLVFEEVTGEDLNWFFNQWFYNHGQPDLKIRHRYNDTTSSVVVYVDQTQDFDKSPLFRLPIDIDIYTGNKVERHRVFANKVREKFEFGASRKPDMVNVDADKVLMCTKKVDRSQEELVFLYNNGPLYQDRYEAIQDLGKTEAPNELVANTMIDALADKHWNIKVIAIKSIGKLVPFKKEAIRSRLMDLAEKDARSDVRVEAIAALAQYYTGEDIIELYRGVIKNDKSYKVMSAALTAMGSKKASAALDVAKDLESDRSRGTVNAIMKLYSEIGRDAEVAYFRTITPTLSGAEQYNAVTLFAKMLKKCSDKAVLESVSSLELIGRNGSTWYIKLAAVQSLTDISDKYGKENKELQEKITKNKMIKADNQNPKLEAQVADNNKVKKPIDDIIASIKKNETDPNLQQIYGTAGQIME